MMMTMRLVEWELGWRATEPGRPTTMEATFTKLELEEVSGRW